MYRQKPILQTGSTTYSITGSTTDSMANSMTNSTIDSMTGSPKMVRYPSG
jgi:hypothetical protein